MRVELKNKGIGAKVDVYVNDALFAASYPDGKICIPGVDVPAEVGCANLAHLMQGAIRSLGLGNGDMLALNLMDEACFQDKARNLEEGGLGSSEMSEYPRSDWKYEVSNGDTSLGYWEWVSHARESDTNCIVTNETIQNSV